MRHLQWLLSVSLFAASLHALAWPKSVDDQITELEKKAEYAAESLLTTYGLDEAEQKLIEIMMMSFSLAREARDAKSPLLKQATEQRLHEIIGDSENPAKARLKSVKKPIPDPSVFYPEFLNRAFLFVENKVNYSLPHQGYSDEEVSKIKAVLISLSAEFANYATEGSFKSKKFRDLFEIVRRNPVTTYNDFVDFLKVLIQDQWKLRRAGNMAQAQAELHLIKLLYVQAEGIFKNPLFRQLEGAETLYEFKQRPGSPKRYNRPGEKQNNVTMDDLDLNRPLILDHFISEVSRLQSFANAAEVGKDYVHAAKLLYAELQARRATGGSYTKVLTDLRQGSGQSVDRALKFFESQDNQGLIGNLKQAQARGLIQYIFPLLLKANGSPRLSHLKERTKKLLGGWKDSGFIEPIWVTDRLEELAATSKPRLGYASVDAEAKDLLDFAYLGDKYDKDKEAVFFDFIFDFAKRYPEIVKTYLANGEPGRKYFVRLVQERGGLHLLSEAAKTQLLGEFFTNPADRTKAKSNIEIPRLESMLKSGVMDLATLVDLYFAISSDSFQKKEIEQITNREINKIQDLTLQRRIKSIILRKMVNGDSQLLGTSILDILKISLTPNFCSRLFKIRP